MSTSAAMKEEPGTDIQVVNQNTDLSVLSQEDVAEMFEQKGQGLEEITSQDVNIPFLVVLQAMSPAATKASMDYVKGAEAGMILNKSAREEGLYSGADGVYIVPVKYLIQYTEWVPRTKGGGFVSQHDESIMKVAVKQEKGGLKLPNGNDLVRSTVWFVLLVDPKSQTPVQPAIMSLTGSQIRSGKVMNTSVKGLRGTGVDPKDGQTKQFIPPAWASVFKATTLPKSNEHGSWYVWNFTRLGYTKKFFGDTVNPAFGQQVYSMGKEMLDSIKSGVIKAAAPSEDEVAQAGAAKDEDF